jgi:hypothetical protein
MRVLLLFLCLQACRTLDAQILICRDGVTSFKSEAPLELIQAKSNKTNGAIDTKAKTVAFTAEINNFEGFNSELQKEHFRENYMESDQFPMATFKGKIIDDIDFSKIGVVMVRAKGIFTVHGTDKEKIIKVKIIVKDNGIVEIETEFEVPLEDHNIKIPKVVNQKIASVITVHVKAVLRPRA